MKKYYFVLGLAVFLLTCVYWFNVIDANNVGFSTFQLDSENLINLSVQHTIEGGAITAIGYTQYASNFGLQAHLFRLLSFVIPQHIGLFNGICAFLMAMVAVGISVEIRKAISTLCGLVFFLTFLLSPWIVNFARNLYWVEFTWFLPVWAGLLYYNRTKRKVQFYYILMFITVLIKSLCGYEYITTILIASMSVPLLELFKSKTKEERKKTFFRLCILGGSAVVAVLLAMCIHALALGQGNLVEGFARVHRISSYRMAWSNELGAEVIADSSAVGILMDSFNASFATVILRYLSLGSEIIYGVNGALFIPMMLAALAITIFESLHRKAFSKKLVLFILYFVATISWFVLASPHSYIHYGINNVLWYIGFVPMCLYICADFFCACMARYVCAK